MGARRNCTLDFLGHELHITIMINKHYAKLCNLEKIKLKNRTVRMSLDMIHMLESVKVALRKSDFKETLKNTIHYFYCLHPVA
jgi:hypothetical protein